MEFDKVTAQHIKQGIKDFEEKGFPNGFGPSSTYDISYEGKSYPSKAVMAYANYHAIERKIERYFKGGKGTDCFKAIERNGFEIVAKKKKDLFNWTKTHLELANYLRDKRSSTAQLIELLKESGVNVMQDQSEPNVSEPLEEMDPFTFICHIYKYGEKKRLEIIQKIAKKLDLFIPDGERGIPSANAQKVWMFPYKYTRKGNEFEILWELFDAVINDTITNDLFQRALNIRNVGKTKLTEVLFYVRPFDYFPLNGPSRPYIKEELGIDHNFETFEEYQEINRRIKSKSDTSFPELSYQSWHYTNDKNSKTDSEQLAIDEEVFKRVISKFSAAQIDGFFEFLDQINDKFNISSGDERFTYTVPKWEKRVSFLIGQRIAFSLDLRNKRGVFEVISKEQFGEVTFEYEGNDEVVMIGCDDTVLINQNKESVFEQMEKEIASTVKSGFRKNLNTSFEKVVFDTAYRSQFLDKNFTVKEPTANYQTTSMSLNQILYGPPGTGKTYKLQAEYFDRFTKKGTATTKEDFLTDIVADMQWWEVYYLALLEKPDSKVSDLISHPAVIAKSSLSSINNLKASAWGCLQRHTMDECNNVNVRSRATVRVFWKNEDKTWKIADDIDDDIFPQATEILNKYYNYEPSIDEVIKNYEFVTFHQSFTYEDFVEGIKPVLEEDNTELQYKITNGVFKRLANLARNNPSQPYAIFIDEINRGNVASIFGELITLIETDKRAGAENELSVILPYSKTKFSVPKNLHIIGTMNTADRSIEALDSALRRRFEFIEMLPDYDVIDEVLDHQEFANHKLSEILKTINNRITVLINRDHQIGHSYFLKLKNSNNLEADLKAVFMNKIIPLLQEYFFNDYIKIAMVIGEGFMDKNTYAQVTFAQNDGDYDTDYNDLVKYEIKKEVDLVKAISLLMGADNA